MPNSEVTLTMSDHKEVAIILECEMPGYIVSSIFSGLSTIEYFTAMTTVALVNAVGLVVRTYRKLRV